MSPDEKLHTMNLARGKMVKRSMPGIVPILREVMQHEPAHEAG